ncbi:TorF family putative porin [Sphingomonas endolithica]|uniref:TorF family putative porin n=1 Tax=Sphingomonas endolithica TaxID=2972485 RepID=UPI0021AF1BB8|nr:TorF family putative porin [Sphingomonas sp. ZFBP2030]
MMRISTLTLSTLLLLATATPAFAQDEPAGPPPEVDTSTPAFKVTGGVTLVSDYRFRGTTQTDEQGAIQGTVNINHSSGFYVGTWASTIDGDGDTPALTGYGKAEIDLYGGFTKTLSNGLGVDVGLLYYLYTIDEAKGLNTDFFEPYASVSYTLGPVSTKLGAAYAWGGQKGLAGFDVKGGNDDNIYVYGEAALGVPTTPVTLKGHLGYSDGALGSLNAPGTNDNTYFDWSLTAEAVGGPFKVGVSYVDTDISDGQYLGTAPKGFAQARGRGATVLGYVGVSF